MIAEDQRKAGKFMPVRLSRYPIFGVSCDGDGREEFIIDEGLHDFLHQNGPEWKYRDSGLIPDVLREPTSIFRGLRRQGFDEALCYCGKPRYRWVGDERRTATPPGMIFAVYILPEQDRLLVVDWAWLREHRTEPGHPETWESDYERKTWPTT